MLKQRVIKGEKLVGMYVQLTDPSIARIAGLAGYDFVWVDTEHSYMSFETLFSHILALRSTGTPVVVRAPQNDLTATKKIMEMGIDGIIFPMVKTAKEARKLMAATVYPSGGGERGFGPMNAIDYGFKSMADYVQKADDSLCRFIQVEHRETIENLDDILQIPYIDGYIIGPNDLSGSYGMLGDVFSEPITDVIKQVIEKLHAENKYVGIASGGYQKHILEHWANLEPDLLAAGADFDFIRDSALQNRLTLQTLLGK